MDWQTNLDHFERYLLSKEDLLYQKNYLNKRFSELPDSCKMDWIACKFELEEVESQLSVVNMFGNFAALSRSAFIQLNVYGNDHKIGVYYDMLDHINKGVLASRELFSHEYFGKSYIHSFNQMTAMDLNFIHVLSPDLIKHCFTNQDFGYACSFGPFCKVFDREVVYNDCW